MVLNLPRVLYISYDGLAEPLGQSQVVTYLSKLSCQFDISVISFEKYSDINGQQFNSVKLLLEQSKIHWTPLTYTKSPKLLGTAWDILKGVFKGLHIIFRRRILIVHSRSYIAGLMGLIVSLLGRTHFVFDIRGFWIDERLEAGQWSPGSILVQFLRAVERLLYNGASKIVILARAGESFVKLRAPEIADDDIYLIPTCVDVSKFVPSEMRIISAESEKSTAIVFGYLGSLGGVYDFASAVQFVKYFKSFWNGSIKLKIISQSSRKLFLNDISVIGLYGVDIEILAVPFDEVPAELDEIDIGLCFYNPGLSRAGACPTKLGEYFAAGKPCVASGFVGDVAHWYELCDLGICVHDRSHENLKEAADSLAARVFDFDKTKIRQFAENELSLEMGVEKYRELYDSLV